MGGRINGPGMERSMELFKFLWNSFFPDMDSRSGKEVRAPALDKLAPSQSEPDEVDQLPVADFGYYFELKAYSSQPSVKLYLPARYAQMHAIAHKYCLINADL